MSTQQGEKPPRKRPWRCTLCGDRFAGDQTNNPHVTIYDPREWELE